MDIAQIDTLVAQSEESHAVTIYQPNREPNKGADGKDATISVLGNESKKYREARDGITRRALRGRRSNLTPEEIQQNRIDLAVAAVTGWSGWESGGKPYAFTPENARKLFAVEHILSQVEEGIAEHANFSRASSNGSRT